MLVLTALWSQDRDGRLRATGNAPRCHFFPSFFYNKLWQDKGAYCYAEVARWTRAVRLQQACQVSPYAAGMPSGTASLISFLTNASGHTGPHGARARPRVRSHIRSQRAGRLPWSLDPGGDQPAEPEAAHLRFSRGMCALGCAHRMWTTIHPQWFAHSNLECPVDLVNPPTRQQNTHTRTCAPLVLQGKHLEAAEHLKRWIHDESVAATEAGRCTKALIARDWAVEHVDSPRQANMIDCGAFVMHFAERLGCGEPFNKEKKFIDAFRVTCLHQCVSMRV